MSKVKSSATNSREATTSVLAVHLQAVPSSSLGVLPSMKCMKRTIQRTRQAAQIHPIVATTRSEIPDLSGRFLTIDGGDFLKIDVTISSPNERVLVFSTNKNLDWLQASHHWFCDGTFKSSPSLFDQLIVIHGLRLDGNKVTCFPLVCILAPNRLQRTYYRIFTELKSLQPGLAPISIMTDFETGLRNAFVKAFPQVTLRGCWFHFRQCNVKHIQGI